MRRGALRAGALVLAGLLAAPAARAAEDPPAPPAAADSDAEIVKKLNNPVASLISVPFQSNFDFGLGKNDSGFQYKLNFQPVIPIGITEDWNVITRVILPVIHQSDVIGGSRQAGLGDTTPSFFLSPKEPWHSTILGVGPVFLFPTATNDLLGTEKWGVGPTAVVLQQRGPWTFGILANHIWSFAGASDRTDVSSTFLQPFLSYSLPSHTTFTLNSESTYDWEGEQWTVPLNAMVSQLVRIGKLPVQFQGGARYYAETPRHGPNWGLRFATVLVLPSFGSPNARGLSLARSGYDGSFYRIMFGPKYYFTPNIYGRAAFAADWYEGKVLNTGGLRPFDDGTKNHQQIVVFDLVGTF